MAIGRLSPNWALSKIPLSLVRRPVGIAGSHAPARLSSLSL